MATYHYTLRGFSQHGSLSKEGVITGDGTITLDELIREIERVTGETLVPVSSNAVLMVNERRVDWDTGCKMPLRDGDRFVWITPAFGG